MTFRLTLVIVLLAAFAFAFAKLAEHDNKGADPGSPCEEWSNPDCRPPAVAPPS